MITRVEEFEQWDTNTVQIKESKRGRWSAPAPETGGLPPHRPTTKHRPDVGDQNSSGIRRSLAFVYQHRLEKIMRKERRKKIIHQRKYKDIPWKV